MKTVVLGFIAETPIHAGSGRAMGVVDLPVAREAATDYPVIPGSSLKGALRDAAEGRGIAKERVDHTFGKHESAGRLLISDARLLLLPVRSLDRAYRWATCPLILERFSRDLARAGLPAFKSSEVRVDAEQILANGNELELVLEERVFRRSGAVPPGIVSALASLIAHEETRTRVGDQIVVLRDEDFAWFARWGLPVQARNVLDEKTKTSKNLWYEETLPTDTVMYALTMNRYEEGGVEILGDVFPEGRSYLQVGGNETVGQGWFAVTTIAAKEAR